MLNYCRDSSSQVMMGIEGYVASALEVGADSSTARARSFSSTARMTSGSNWGSCFALLSLQVLLVSRIGRDRDDTYGFLVHRSHRS
jgi:hypothetical protein